MSTRCSLYYDGIFHIYHEMSGKFAISIDSGMIELSPDYEGILVSKNKLKAMAEAILKHVDQYEEY